jgi:HD-like signal output (HDOD) protein
MGQCKNLIICIGIKSLFRKIGGAAQAQCKVLWQHGHVTAYLCRQLNRAYRLGFGGEEFSAGLLHDLGRILLVLADPECAARAGALDFDEPADQLAAERAVIGIDHCAVGGWFSDLSRLPTALIHTMWYHHEPGVTENSRRLVALVATADHIANHLQRGDEVAAYDPEDNRGLACLWEGWPEAKKVRLVDELPARIEEAAQVAAGEQTVA